MDIQQIRQSLAEQHAAHDQQAKHYTGLVIAIPKGAPETEETAAVRAAWLGHTMAATYSHNLALVLRLVSERVDSEVAAAIASDINLALEEGDAFD